ncbi:hypothetical protein I6A60_31135 [Frankia sp. AgB1.9]|uniref:DUF6585 family protein n=1 Tax=unclassified Frankia TaxID=2632575 RepID=UPI00193296A7|nr:MULTISPECIES: DUF6585 family protein [unclassified Frankia]MBL7493275.1 hypothetical protein [Frankia sp. AgW1.1]MBL7552284.1 hypothetical protein [Frankia sp. AgB1.9]MBL7625579.1 hypothetical protein [Frankia sp. AgB1.8]
MADRVAPAEVARAAQARGLGRLESWHTPGWSAVVPPVLGVGMIAFGVILCVADLTVLATVLGVLFVGAGGVLIQVGVKAVEWTYVHEGGLVARSLTRRTPRAFAWSDVVHLGSSWTKRYVNGSYTGMYGSYVFHLPQGRRISLTFNAAPRDVDKLPRHVEGRIAAQQLPSRIAWLRAGQDVDFGAFTLGPAGISVDGRDLTWPGIAAADVTKGVLTITARSGGTLLARPVKKVLDFQVFFWLFERVVGQPSWQHALAQLEPTREAS